MNVGDYVRTPNGVIAKIIDIKDDEGQYFINNNAVSLSSKTYISDKNITIGENFKHSPNIIDLIEVGDIVNYEQLNGGVVLNKKDDSIDTWSILPNSLKNEDIKLVITKEQLKKCMYEVGE